MSLSSNIFISTEMVIIYTGRSGVEILAYSSLFLASISSFNIKLNFSFSPVKINVVHSDPPLS